MVDEKLLIVYSFHYSLSLSGLLLLLFLSSFVSANLSDNLGLHRVENASHTDAAVSLHLYCPPYSSCSIFNQKTGKQTKCNVTFYSQFGKRREKVGFSILL